METQQIGYFTPPNDEEQTLLFTLMCQTCKTYRSFVYNINLLRVVQRQDAGLGIESTCDVCNTKIGISLFWSSERPGYLKENPADTYKGEVATVNDNVPMTRLGEKPKSHKHKVDGHLRERGMDD